MVDVDKATAAEEVPGPVLSFDWWWAMLLLPLPALVRWMLPAMERGGTALAVPLLYRRHVPGSRDAGSPLHLARVCRWLFWLCLILAASRPLWLGDPISRTTSGRDLLLAVDISGSMNEPDMTIDGRNASRIDVLKIVVEEFIDRREGDRLGLILFGTNAYTFVPLTFDLDTLKQLLRDVSTGLAGRHTAIGDAIGLAVKSLREQASQHKVLILVTDGRNTRGFDDPVVTALAAWQHGLTIYTIGIGSDTETQRRSDGVQNVPQGAASETVLRQIAAVTGGRYYRATDKTSLEHIYTALDELEPIEREYQSYRPRIELFAIPLGLGIVLVLVFIGVTSRVVDSPEP